MYVGDTYNHRIMAYASGTSNGMLVLDGNGPEINNTQLNLPMGLHFDSLSNSLIIANYGTNNILQYVLGTSGWTLLEGDVNGSSDSTSILFNRPGEVLLDTMGNMYVSDINNHHIQVFYTGQVNGTTIAGSTGVVGSNATTLYSPRSLRLDSQLNLYVAHTMNHRIQKVLRY